MKAVEFLDLKKGLTEDQILTAIREDPREEHFQGILSMTTRQLQNLMGHSNGAVLELDGKLVVKQKEEGEKYRDIGFVVEQVDEATLVHEQAHADLMTKSKDLTSLKTSAHHLTEEIKAIRVERPARSLLAKLCEYIITTPAKLRIFGNPLTHPVSLNFVRDKMRLSNWSLIVALSRNGAQRSFVILYNLGFEYCKEYQQLWNKTGESLVKWQRLMGKTAKLPRGRCSGRSGETKMKIRLALSLGVEDIPNDLVFEAVRPGSIASDQLPPINEVVVPKDLADFENDDLKERIAAMQAELKRRESTD